MATEVGAVSCTHVNPKLDHALADRLAVPEISRLNPPQPNPDTRFGGLVAQAGEPLGKRFAAILALIPQQLHGVW